MSETWTYYNANTIQVSGDLTAKYLPNQLLRLTQDGAVKFFIVIAVALVDGNTHLTINGAGVYTLTSSAITARAMASQGAHSGIPFGFVDAAAICGASSKTTPADTDEVPMRDSETPFGLRKLAWSNIKAALKAYFDSLYATSAKGVTNGDSHNHNGGDGAQIDHGSLGGLGDNDHGLGSAAYENTSAFLASSSYRGRLGVAADETVWAIASDGALKRWSGSAWTDCGGTCLAISAVSSTTAYVVGTDGKVYKYVTGGTGWSMAVGTAIP
jgi:hypothetical protein